MVTLPTYTTVEAHGARLKVFRCADQAATLTPAGCASRHTMALDGKRRGLETSERLEACRSCAIGALHAGFSEPAASPLYGVAICPRCEVGTMRMIADRVCVNCYNREREAREGRNARGNSPKKFAGLAVVPLLVLVDGRPVADQVEVAAPHLHKVHAGKSARGVVQYRQHRRGGAPEAIRRSLRTTARGLAFVPAYRAQAAIQLELRFAA